MGRPGRPGPSAGAARRRRSGRRCAGHRSVGGGAGAAGVEDDPRLAVHRTAGLRAVHRRPRLRRRPPVHQPGPRPGRRTGVRLLRRLSHEPRRYACRRRGGPHGPALHRCEGDPRTGPPRPALPGRGPLAGDHPGGRRPAHGGRGECAAQGGRGARAAHGVAALRPLPRRCAAHHPVPLPSSHAAHPVGRRRRRCADPARRDRSGAGRVRRASHAGTHRPGPPPRHRREGPCPPRGRAQASAQGRGHRRLSEGGPGADRHRCRRCEAGIRRGRRQGDGGHEGRARRGRRAGCRAARRG